MTKHFGTASVRFSNPPSIIGAAAIVGPKEGEGPLASYFDKISADILFNKDTWEQAESELMRQTIELAVQKAGLSAEEINYILAGDLLNQNSGSVYGARSFGRPFFGLFGACSAIGMAMGLGAMIVDGGFADNVVANASSHFCGAEKTFRFPLELGTQRAPTASWTVTGDGAVVLSSNGNGPFVTSATTGAIVDLGQKDVNNMGAAMAPAAAEVIKNHFNDLYLPHDYYDVIATGDLGLYGSKLAEQLLQDSGFDFGERLVDCGALIFDNENQDTHAGGSGCGCSATVFAGYFMKKIRDGEIKKMLLVPTGALHSVVTIQQGETIPGIAHAVAIERKM
ncbi:MAG: stage V sporulation protein AD [Defluviitaleaceae bacterium]|nr:stage V sporulation protein AD [Defluviitaleaceae bacterium]MCL2199291.1 stage V sporulation protein AD [Defluviitaleaceae bacterium]